MGRLASWIEELSKASDWSRVTCTKAELLPWLQELLAAREELAELRANDLGALLARVPMEYRIGVMKEPGYSSYRAFVALSGSGRSYVGEGETRGAAIRAATAKLEAQL
jgi:hypothetical protein